MEAQMRLDERVKGYLRLTIIFVVLFVVGSGAVSWLTREPRVQENTSTEGTAASLEQTGTIEARPGACSEFIRVPIGQRVRVSPSPGQGYEVVYRANDGTEHVWTGANVNMSDFCVRGTGQEIVLVEYAFYR